MSLTKDGFYKQIGGVTGDNSYLLLGGGSLIKNGNASGNVPISNGTLNVNLNADLLDGYHKTDLIGNLSKGSWNPRGTNLAMDWYYNGGDMSISESGGQISVSIDGYFYQNEGQYRVLDENNYPNYVDSRYVLKTGDTMVGTPYINMPASAASISNNQPFGITYGRIQGYGDIFINADTDGSTSEYVHITAGYGAGTSGVSYGLGVGYNNLYWKGGVLFANTSNVGIGTTSPVEKLDVVGNIRSVTSSRSGWSYRIIAGNTTDGVAFLGTYNNGSLVPGVYSHNEPLNSWNDVGIGGTTIRFYLNGTENSRLDLTGLGIGTTSPSYKLDVAGTGRIRESLIVSSNNTTGGGIILADDGDIVDLNDGFASMRFSYGVRIYSANRGGSWMHELNANGILYNYGVYHRNYGSYDYLLTSNGDARHIGSVTWFNWVADLTSLSNTNYYPVLVQGIPYMRRIKIRVNGEHYANFSDRGDQNSYIWFTEEISGSGWSGTGGLSRIIHGHEEWGGAGYGILIKVAQLTCSSSEVFWLRGGASYNISSDYYGLSLTYGSDSYSLSGGETASVITGLHSFTKLTETHDSYQGSVTGAKVWYADVVDDQHFNWSNWSNDPTWIWATNDYGNAYLAYRSSLNVNSAAYIRSMGDATIVTGRNFHYDGAYTYRIYGQSGYPTYYAAVIGFGHGSYGSAEVAVEWTQNNGIYYRSAGDWQSWSAWKRIYDDSYHPYADYLTREIEENKLPPRLRAYGQNTSDHRNVDSTCLENGFYWVNSGTQPPNVGDADIITVNANSSYGHQLAFKFSGGGTTGSSYDGKDLYTRIYSGGSWLPWYTIYTSGNTGWNYDRKIRYEPHTRKFVCSKGYSSWDTQFYSTDGYVTDVEISFKIGQRNCYVMVGLNSDPTADASYSSIDYCWYPHAGGTVEIYENGSYIGNWGSYSIGDEFAINYSGGFVRYYWNGTLIRTVARGKGSKLYADASFHNDGYIYDVWFGKKSHESVGEDNQAINAIIHSGYGRGDNDAGSTWLFVDDAGGYSSTWGIRHDQPSNLIEYYGAGTRRAYINLSDGTINSYGRFMLNGYGGNYHSSNNISGLAGEIWFGGNFHLDSQNGYNMYLNYYNPSTIYLNGSSYWINSSGQTNMSAAHLLINGNTWWSNWYWDGRGDSPTWIWGSHDYGSNNYLFHQSNITVGYARSLSRSVVGIQLSSAGWKRVLIGDNTDNRGSVRFALHTTGGNWVPYYTEIKAQQGWDVTDFTMNGQFPYINALRFTRDSSHLYIEAYFTTNVYVEIYHFNGVGYVDDMGGWSLPSGEINGGDSVVGEEWSCGDNYSLFGARGLKTNGQIMLQYSDPILRFYDTNASSFASTNATIQFNNSYAIVGYIEQSGENLNIVSTGGSSWVNLSTNGSNKLSVSTYGAIILNQTVDRRTGIVGHYDYTHAAAIWAMGESYQIASDGSSLGNLYGAAYVYEGQAGTGGRSLAYGHQFVWADAGDVRAALGYYGVWARRYVVAEANDARVIARAQSDSSYHITLEANWDWSWPWAISAYACVVMRGYYGNTYLNLGVSGQQVGIQTDTAAAHLHIANGGGFLYTGDGSLKLYEIDGGYSCGPETIGIQTCFDGVTNPDSHSYVNDYWTRCFLALQPRNGVVGIGCTTYNSTMNNNGTYKLIVNGSARFGTYDLDNSTWKNTISLFANQSSETWGEGIYNEVAWGIGFKRQWSSGSQNVTSAGIYAVGSSGWRTGLAFRVKDNTGSDGYSHDRTALWLSPGGRVGINTGDPGQRLHVWDGLIAVTCNGYTLTMGNQNGSWTHMTTSGTHFWFNPSVCVDGNVYPYYRNNNWCGTTGNYWYRVSTAGVIHPGVGSSQYMFTTDGGYVYWPGMLDYKYYQHFRDENFNPITSTWHGYGTGMTTQSGITGHWWHVWSSGWSDNTYWISQIAVPTADGWDSNHMMYRTYHGGDYGWRTVLDNTNYTSYTDGRYLRYEGWWNSGSGQNVDDAHGIIFAYSDHGVPGSWGTLLSLECERGNGYRHQIHGRCNANELWHRYRNGDNGSWSGWAKVLDTDNSYVSGSWGYINGTRINWTEGSDRTAHLLINGVTWWSNWNWSGQGGQPTWIWGSNDGTNMYVWNPSNFSVSWANSCGNADTVDGYHLLWTNKWGTGDGYTFSNNGLRIQQTNDESSGIHFNGDYINMWSPCDGNYSLRYFDEDNGNEVWHISSSGYFSGSAASANYATSAGNADTLDGYHLDNLYWADQKIQTSSTSWTTPTFSQAYVHNWFRVNNSGGIYWEAYGGGWYMDNSDWIKSYNNKSLFVYTSELNSSNKPIARFVKGSDCGNLAAWDTVVISSNDCTTLRLWEGDGTCIAMCAGDYHGTFTSTHDFRFYTQSSTNLAAYNGGGGTLKFSITHDHCYTGNSLQIGADGVITGNYTQQHEICGFKIRPYENLSVGDNICDLSQYTDFVPGFLNCRWLNGHGPSVIWLPIPNNTLYGSRIIINQNYLVNCLVSVKSLYYSTSSSSTIYNNKGTYCNGTSYMANHYGSECRWIEIDASYVDNLHEFICVYDYKTNRYLWKESYLSDE